MGIHSKVSGDSVDAAIAKTVSQDRRAPSSTADHNGQPCRPEKPVAQQPNGGASSNAPGSGVIGLFQIRGARMGYCRSAPAAIAISTSCDHCRPGAAGEVRETAQANAVTTLASRAQRRHLQVATGVAPPHIDDVALRDKRCLQIRREHAITPEHSAEHPRWTRREGSMISNAHHHCCHACTGGGRGTECGSATALGSI